VTLLRILLSSALLLAACANEKTSEPSLSHTGFCFSGGKIYTANDNQARADAVAVKGNKITYVGAASNPNWCETNAGSHPAIINLNGAALYPGLTDGHAHLIGIGLRELTLNLDQVKSITELQSILKTQADKTPPGETIYGRGWIETHWPEKRFPTRLDLDTAAPNHPVILERADGHAVVVNTKALQLSKITANTPSPFGGDIRKDTAGQPDGMLIDNAAKLVESLMPKLTPERREKAYVVGADVYAKRGWTNIHSMSVDPDDIPLINRLANEGRIKIRIYNSIDLLEGRDMPSMIKGTQHNNLVTTRAIKLYADGALGSRGAALLQPYSDDPNNSGLMTLKESTVGPILEAALLNGTQVNIHAIGDKANQRVLHWYEKAFKAVPAQERPHADPRWRIEHAQILSLTDIQKFAQLGIIPSMQPSHAIGDLHFAIDRLGVERLKGGYAWNSLAISGTIIAGGSDAPVEVGDPRIELYAAIARKDANGFSTKGWYPEEALSPELALKMFTAWPAYASFQEKDLGTIEVGKLADFTIMETDFMTAIPKDILTSSILMTIVDGKIAYDGR